MKIFKVGDNAKVIEMPDKGKHLVGEIVTIVPIGGFDYADDDVCVKLANSTSMMVLKEHQLLKIQD